VKTADLGILLGAPLSSGDYSMTRVAGLLSHALSMLSSGEYSQIATDLSLLLLYVLSSLYVNQWGYLMMLSVARLYSIE
jgi:hypothetical protein